MKVTVNPSAPQLVISGELDLATAGELSDAGVDALDTLPTGQRLELDMREVTFVDSSGIGVLVSLRNAAGAMGSKVALVQPSSAIVRLLELTGLRDSFTVVADPR